MGLMSITSTSRLVTRSQHGKESEQAVPISYLFYLLTRAPKTPHVLYQFVRNSRLDPSALVLTQLAEAVDALCNTLT